MLEIGDYVVLFDGRIGIIKNIRVDSEGDPVFTIVLSEHERDGDDFYYARFCEIEKYVYGVN